MSNVIPILSSSPPPIDDTPSFDESWESNRYDSFQDVGPLGGTASFLPQQSTNCAKPDHTCRSNDKPANNGVMGDSSEDDWADFSGPVAPPPPVVDGEFVASFTIDDRKTGSSASMTAKDVSLDGSLPPAGLPEHMGLQLRSTIDRTAAHGDGRKSPRSSSSSTGSQEDRHNSCGEDFNARTHEPKFPKTDTQDNTSQDSVTDSGLCSDISPVPKFEEYPDFGDNKSSEVEFSDECQGKVGTILEQDEGFANFGTRDSCGTGSDNQSPDRDSLDHTEAFSVGKHNPRDFMPGSTFKEDDAGDTSQGQFSCSSGEGPCVSAELDPDAVTPTQAQYDAETLESLNSPNPKISPDQDNVSETVSYDLSPETFNAGQLGESAADIDGSCETLLEGSQAKSAEPHETLDNFSDLQSTGSVTNFASFPEDDLEVDTMTSSCVSSGAQPVPPSKNQLASSGPTESSHIATKPVAARQTAGESDDDDDSDDDSDEWDFKDAVADECDVDPAAMQRQSPTLAQLGTVRGNDDSDSEDEFGNFGDFASQPAVDASQMESAGNDGEDDEDGDGWAFQGTTKASHDDDDDGDDNDDDNEFGDFGDFSSTAPQSGFADFGSSPKQTGAVESNWAAFATPALALPADEDLEEDEFGNFREVTPFSSVGTDAGTKTPSSTADHQQSVHELSKMESAEVMVGRSFPLPMEANELPAVDVLYTHMTRQTLRQQAAPAKQPGRHTNVKSTTTDMSVWNNLRDLEKTAALRYTWDKSTTSNCLLHALAIDTRNILIGHKKTSMPIFAANLGSGVLEPSRGLPEVGREGRVSDVVTTTHVPSNIKLTAGTPQDIPPAEFDWSSAGLTNPLDSSNIQLDLDFFITKTAWSGYSAHAATSPTAALENELLKSIEPLESKQPKTLEPLENYLANLKVAPTAPPSVMGENDADHLSEAAYDIVTHFPPINFMHAKMLMFPVKGTVTD